MRQIWEFLLANPIMFFVLAAWAAGAIGNAIRTKSSQRRAAERKAPQQQAQPLSTTQPSLQPDRTQTVRRATAEPPPIVRSAQVSASASRSPDEIAAEMRRILGLDVDITPVEHRRAEVVRREAPRVETKPQRPPTPVLPTTQSRHLQLLERSHVGEGLEGRKGPRSGLVGEHDKSWGTLGGRVEHVHHGTAPVRMTTVQRLIDLSDLKRTILAAEILGPPICLRGESEIRSM